MLILHRKKNESILIGDHIRVTVIECASGGVRLAIDAPKQIPVIREELAEAAKMNKASLVPDTNSIRSLQDALKLYFNKN